MNAQNRNDDHVTVTIPSDTFLKLALGAVAIVVAGAATVLLRDPALGRQIADGLGKTVGKLPG